MSDCPAGNLAAVGGEEMAFVHSWLSSYWVRSCVRKSFPSESPLFTGEAMPYLAASLVDFHLQDSRESLFQTPELSSSGEAALVPHSLHQRSGSWDC